MNNDEIPAINLDRLEDRFFQEDGQRFHWGGRVDIEYHQGPRHHHRNREPMDRRVNQTRPGLIRQQKNKELVREVYVPRRPENSERKKSKESTSS